MAKNKSNTETKKETKQADTAEQSAPKKDEAKQEDAKAQTKKSKWVYIRDINSGQYKVGDPYEGKDHKELEKKGLIEQK